MTPPRPARPARPSGRRTIPAQAGLPRWLFDHHPLALVVAGLSVLLATALLLDPQVYRLALGIDPALHQVFARITRLGCGDWSILLAAGLCLGFALRARSPARDRDAVLWRNAAGQAGFVLAVLLTSGVAANVLKWGLGRARPFLSHGMEPFQFGSIATSAGWASFPSGHATTITALAVALSFLWPRMRLAFLSLALWVAASRLVVGAHWTSDVMAGVALGTATVYALRLWHARRGRVFVLRRNRLQARTRSLWPLIRRERAGLLVRLSVLAAKVTSRLTNGPGARSANHPDLGRLSGRAARSGRPGGVSAGRRGRAGRA